MKQQLLICSSLLAVVTTIVFWTVWCCVVIVVPGVLGLSSLSQPPHHRQQHRQPAILNPAVRAKIASSITKGERRAYERALGHTKGPRQLCPRCSRPYPIQCVCESLPPPDERERKKINLRTDVVILQHPTEFRRKTFSTVPLLKLVLNNVHVVVGHNFNDLDTPGSVLRDAIVRHGGRKPPLLLFPGDDDAIDLEDGSWDDNYDPTPSSSSLPVLSDETLMMMGRLCLSPQEETTTTTDDNATNITGSTNSTSSNRQLLILIDGTWTQAKRMARNSPQLFQYCQQVQFGADSGSELSGDDASQTQQQSKSKSIYDAIRKEPDAHCLSTLEACAKALVLLEPPGTKHLAVKASEYLHGALQLLVEKQLLYRRNSISNSTSIIASNSSMSTESSYDPRYVGKGSLTVLKKRKQRLEVEAKLFGGEIDSDGLEYRNSMETSTGTSYDLGDGSLLRQLDESDAQFVNSRWPYSSKNNKKKKSLGMIQQMIRHQNQYCLGIEHDGELRACILRYHHHHNNRTTTSNGTTGGALGMLHVDEAYRRRGYGTALVAEATRRLLLVEQNESKANTGRQEDEDDEAFCSAYIMDGNTASEALFRKLGWVLKYPNAKRGTGRRRSKRRWIYIKEDDMIFK